MRKFLLVVAIVFATASLADAQIAAGKYMIGGNVNLNSVGGNTAWALNPSVGYFLTDDIALGGTLNLFDAGGGFAMNLGVAGRKYWSVLDNTYLYGHVGANIGVVGGGGFNLNIFPGVMYFFNERLAIDGGLNGLGGGGIGLSLLF
jgi:hypothetical protein